MQRIWISIAGAGGVPEGPPPAGGADAAWTQALDLRLPGVRVRVDAETSSGAQPGDASAVNPGEPAGGEWRLRPGGREGGDPWIAIDRASARVRVGVPFTTTAQFFHARTPVGTCVSNDPRLLHRPGMALDPAAVYALLQFGALVAPFSLWRDVRRFAPGTVTEIVPERQFTCEEQSLPLAFEPAPGPSSPLEEEEQVARALDESLRAGCADGRPAILFSGGVDSSLLAARAADLGWKDTLLAHYSRGPEDPETAAARAVARELSLPLAVVEADAGVWGGALGRLAASYPQPLGDFSLVPTMLAVEEVLRRNDGRRTILDGSGADGTFGAFVKLARWKRLYRLPRGLRAAAAAAFRAGSFWLVDRPAARRLAAARVSGRMPCLLASMIAENPLDGIAYRAEPSDRRAVQRAIVESLEAAASWPGDEARSRALDLRHVVCDMTAQKDGPLTLGRREEIRYPFLDPPLVDLGLRSSRAAIPGAPSKAALKRILARRVGEDLVYRPKSGFDPPIREVFAAPAVARMLEEQLLAGATPLAPWLVASVVARLARRAIRGAPLPHASYNFLWTALCASLWLSQFHAGVAGRAPREPERQATS